MMMSEIDTLQLARPLPFVALAGRRSRRRPTFPLIRRPHSRSTTRSSRCWRATPIVN